MHWPLRKIVALFLQQDRSRNLIKIWKEFSNISTTYIVLCQTKIQPTCWMFHINLIKQTISAEQHESVFNRLMSVKTDACRAFDHVTPNALWQRANGMEECWNEIKSYLPIFAMTICSFAQSTFKTFWRECLNESNVCVWGGVGGGGVCSNDHA